MRAPRILLTIALLAWVATGSRVALVLTLILQALAMELLALIVAQRKD